MTDERTAHTHTVMAHTVTLGAVEDDEGTGYIRPPQAAPADPPVEPLAHTEGGAQDLWRPSPSRPATETRSPSLVATSASPSEVASPSSLPDVFSASRTSEAPADAGRELPCSSCGAAVPQAATGRRRKYCEGCRVLAARGWRRAHRRRMRMQTPVAGSET